MTPSICVCVYLGHMHTFIKSYYFYLRRPYYYLYWNRQVNTTISSYWLKEDYIHKTMIALLTYYY